MKRMYKQIYDVEYKYNFEKQTNFIKVFARNKEHAIKLVKDKELKFMKEGTTIEIIKCRPLKDIMKDIGIKITPHDTLKSYFEKMNKKWNEFDNIDNN